MKNTDLPFCLCGCGERVTRPENRFLPHHYIRYKNPMWSKDVSEKIINRQQEVIKRQQEIIEDYHEIFKK